MVDKLRRPLTKEEAEWLHKFNKEFGGFNPTETVDKARRAARVKDVYGNISLTEYMDDWSVEGELPEGIRSLRAWYNPRRPRIEDVVIDQIDKERGAVTSNDITPGIIKRKGGYRASYKGKSRLFPTYQEAIQWLEEKKK